MKLLSAFAIAFLLFSIPVRAADASAVDPKETKSRTPLMRTVDPYKVSAGEQVTVEGDNLDKARVAEVYVSDGKENIPVKVISQEEKKLVFKLPAKIQPGRYAVVVMISDTPPVLIEEPVKINVE